MEIKLNLVNGILYLIYARKSSEDKRQIASIPDQLLICHRLETELSIKVPEQYIFTDKKTAMKAHKRPQFDSMKMLIDLAISKGVRIVIITWNPNRLARNGEEGGYLADRVRDRQIEVFTDTAGWFREQDYKQMYSEFVDAVKYSKETSLGVLKNMLGKVEKGICPTAAHLGYKFNPTKQKGEKDIIKNPLNWDKCREWVELMLTGHYTVEKSLEIMTARGLVANQRGNNPPGLISPSKAYFFFKDIYNLGLFYYHGEQHIGNHTPLMTRKEYDRIQTITQSRSGKKQPLKELPLMGVFKCSFCQGSITGERHTRRYLNGKSQEFCYYRCSRKGPRVKELGKCKEKGLSEKETEKQIMSYIDDIDEVPEFLEWLKKVLKRQNQVMYQSAAKEQELQTKRLVEITKQKFELRAMKNEGFFPDDAEYQKQKADLLRQEQIVKQEIITTDDSIWDALFDDLCHFAKTVRELYQTDDPVIKKMVVEIIGLNFKLEDEKLKIEAKSAFIAMRRVKKDLWEKNLWIEPQNTAQSEAKIPLSHGSFNHSLLYGAGERT